MISPTPPSVKKRVTSTAVPGRYSCFVVNGSPTGWIEKLPPFSESRMEPNRLGASKRSGQNQSIVPSLPTSATRVQVADHAVVLDRQVTVGRPFCSRRCSGATLAI